MKKTKRLSMRQRHILEGYMFISPWIIGFLIFFANPITQSLRLSFSRITQLHGFYMEWAGLVNFERAFVWDVNFIPMFLGVIADTFINTPITLVFSLVIAILIKNKILFRSFFRVVFFLPVLLGTGFVMEQILNLSSGGGSGSIVGNISLPPIIATYLGDFEHIVWEFLERITLIFWSSGVQIILFLAGLQGIPDSLYEAAVCDGATSWEKFWKITFPMISPVILLNFVYTLIDSFTNSNNPLVRYILDYGFIGHQFEYSAAIAWIYFTFVLFVCVAAFGFARKYVYNIGEK